MTGPSRPAGAPTDEIGRSGSGTARSGAVAASTPAYAPPVPSGSAVAAPSASVPTAAIPSAGIPAGSTPTASIPTGSIPTRPPAQNRPRRPVRGPRRARLQLRHIDPWSALKFSLVLSIALFFVWMVAVGVLYGVLNGIDVFSKINTLWSDLNGSSGKPVVTPSLVFGGAAVIGAVNILLFTALATIGAFIYNLCADLVGGLEITLGERD